MGLIQSRQGRVLIERSGGGDITLPKLRHQLPKREIYVARTRRALTLLYDVRWKLEWRYRHRFCTVIAPFLFSTEHRCRVITPFRFSIDDNTELSTIHPLRNGDRYVKTKALTFLSRLRFRSNFTDMILIYDFILFIKIHRLYCLGFLKLISLLYTFQVDFAPAACRNTAGF